MFRSFFTSGTGVLRSKVGEEYYKLLTDVFLTSFVGMAVGGVNYLYNIVVAQQLPEEAFSIYSASVGIIYLIQVPAMTLQTVFTKIVSQNISLNLNNFLRVNLKRFALVGIGLSILLVLLAPTISPLISVPPLYISVMGVVILASIISPITKGALLGLQKIALFNLFLAVETLLKFLLLIVALQYTTDPLYPILAFGLPVLLVGFYILRHVEFEEKAQEPVNLSLGLKSAGTVLLGYFLFNMPYTLDVLLVDVTIRAPYAALSLMGKVVFFGAISLTSAMFANVVKEELRRKRQNLFLLSLLVAITISFGVVIVYMLFGELIVQMIFAGRYTEILSHLIIYSLGIMLYSLSFLFLNFFIAEDSRGHIYSLIVSGFLQIVLYVFNNGTLFQVVTNQLIVFCVMFGLFVAQYLFDGIRKIGDKA